MRILIVDNGTSHLHQLGDLLSYQSFHIVKYSEISNTNYDAYDAVILSGGHDFSVIGNEERLRKEIDLVRNSNKPIFGICFGFEVIAYAFGARLERMDSKEHGVLDIQIIEKDGIFFDIPNFQVFESHRWVVQEPVDDILVLARSKDGIEAFKHKTKHIYAVQFHPEVFVHKSCGGTILHNFINLVEYEHQRKT